MVAVIVGSTGLVGDTLLDQLLADVDFNRVISISRRTTGKKSMKLEEILISDLSELLLKKDQLKGDCYYCCLGTTIKTAGTKQNFRKVDFDAVLDFAKVAEYHQAKSFTLVSAMGANEASMFFYNRVKGEIEKAVCSLSIKAIYIFRPGLLIGSRKELRTFEALAINLFMKMQQVLPSNLLKPLATKVSDLSTFMLNISKKFNKGITVLKSIDI